MSFIALCLDNATAARVGRLFPGTATVEKPNPAEPFPVATVTARPYAVFADGEFDRNSMHPSWFEQCLLIPDGTEEAYSHKGGRTRNLPASPTLETVRDILAEFASGTELRDAMRGLKSSAAAAEKTIDEIVGMTLHEKVREQFALTTVRWEGKNLGPPLAGLTTITSASASLVVHVDEVAPGQALGSGAASSSSSSTTVRLIQPNSDAWTTSELAALWTQIENLDDPSVMFVPNPVRAEQLQRIVSLSLLRKQQPNTAAGAGLKQLLIQIETTSADLDVSAKTLDY